METLKEQLLDIIDGLDEEELRLAHGLVKGMGDKEKVLGYISKKGKNPAKVAKQVFYDLVESHDLEAFLQHIEGDFFSFEQIPKKGNLYDLFQNKFSHNFLRKLLNYNPYTRGIHSGKGELFLSVLVHDVVDNSKCGDVSVGDKFVEVKNQKSSPSGQKGVSFGRNTFKNLFYELQGLLTGEGVDIGVLDSSIRKRPFLRLAYYQNIIQESNKEHSKKYLEITELLLKKYYTDLNLEDLSIQNYLDSFGLLDGSLLESFFSLKALDYYIDQESFSEIFFINADTGDFLRIPVDGIKESIYKSIVEIWWQDGLPRWKCNF